MLSDNSYESFQASQDSTMYNNGSRGWLIRVIGLLSRTIFQVEPLGQLEVELYCGTLEWSLESVTDGDVDFWPVESSIAWVEVPFAGVMFVEWGFQLLLQEWGQILEKGE